jgi:Cu(I)/Ag(I) efflux system periplasmic protein CusF
MNTRHLLHVIGVLALASATTAFAQADPHHGLSTMLAQAAPAARSAMADGEVRTFDRAKGTVTIKHGPLNALGMPAMTMTFVAKPTALLAGLKEGDKVRFMPEQAKDGTLVVTALEIVRN